ncbi:MAG: DUF3160 domain-containing protein, partial [Verrucomicrobiota bacterium]
RKQASLRELGGAIVLSHLLNASGQVPAWEEMDRTIGLFVGMTDSMTPVQMKDLMAASGRDSLEAFASIEGLQAFEDEILKGQVGVQAIMSHYYAKPFGGPQIVMPRSFTFFGQRFVIDSWALSNVVYDRVLWPENGRLTKVNRRIPSGLDVAYTVLGNDSTAPLLAARMQNRNGVAFRDGYPYQHHLRALRRTVDQQEASAWNSDIYHGWMKALRMLSSPTTSDAYPAPMRTEAWAMKTLNTQLASWTQLRHDTLLYTKQSYTGGITCFFPDGFVEPRPEFWGALGDVVALTSGVIDELALTDQSKNQFRDFFSNWRNRVSALKDIAETELRSEALSDKQLKEIRTLMENVELNGYTGEKQFSGWYPSLFYRSRWSGGDTHPSDEWDAIVADVHTDVPTDGSPGAILHEGVGSVNLLLLTAGHAGEKTVYAGPVLSHYEFNTPIDVRLSNTEWKERLRKNEDIPSPPEWTESYLVPRR